MLLEVIPHRHNENSVVGKPICMEELVTHLDRFYADDNDGTDVDEQRFIRRGGAHEHDFVQIAAVSVSGKRIDKIKIIRCSTCNSIFCKICGKLIMK